MAGFYRTADVRGRHVEAYSWGGLTSRSGFRVLWLLLLPFMLANLAGWMGSPRATRSAVHRWLVRCGALAVTLNLLLVTAMVSVDVLGYQCGSRPDCTDRWWLAPLRWGPAAGHPARLVLLGALLPVALLVVLAFLSYRSRQRYEAVRPPGQGEPGDAPPRAPPRPRPGWPTPASGTAPGRPSGSATRTPPPRSACSPCWCCTAPTGCWTPPGCRPGSAG